MTTYLVRSLVLCSQSLDRAPQYGADVTGSPVRGPTHHYHSQSGAFPRPRREPGRPRSRMRSVRTDQPEDRADDHRRRIDIDDQHGAP